MSQLAETCFKNKIMHILIFPDFTINYEHKETKLPHKIGPSKT